MSDRDHKALSVGEKMVWALGYMSSVQALDYVIRDPDPDKDKINQALSWCVENAWAHVEMLRDEEAHAMIMEKFGSAHAVCQMLDDMLR